jgi:preprotein translocase subunit SecE
MSDAANWTFGEVAARKRACPPANPIGSMKNPVEFVREVRQEAGKITWAGRRETMVTTGMVFVFVTIAALFFLAVDQVISTVVQFLLRLI